VATVPSGLSLAPLRIIIIKKYYMNFIISLWIMWYDDTKLSFECRCVKARQYRRPAQSLLCVLWEWLNYSGQKEKGWRMNSIQRSTPPASYCIHPQSWRSPATLLCLIWGFSQRWL
jgi:hypothetical protein